MLKNTFCHIPGIGPKTERTLWNSGLTAWDALDGGLLNKLSPKRRAIVCRYSEESSVQLSCGNAGYFADLLPSSQTWRMFPEFCHSVAYVDIETTGLDGGSDFITTIALYDGENVYHFVKGRNLDEFADCVSRYSLLVTFNGKTFDVPFIRQYLRVPMPHAHIDLRYVLASLGFDGGLKRCEKRLGLDRGDLDGVDGYFAVLLWQDYRRNGNEQALATLLAYNIADVVNLAAIMPLAYNMKIKDTPFHDSHLLPAGSVPPVSPCKPDLETINRIKHQYRW